MFAAVRVRGTIKVHPDISMALRLLGLHAPNTGTVLPENAVTKGQLQRIQDYATFGTVDRKALALMLEMMVALFKVHVKQGFFITSQAYGFEYILLILTVLFVVLISGPGKLSVGKRFFKSKHLH